LLFSELGHIDSAIADFTNVLDNPERDPNRDDEIKAHLGSVYNKLGVLFHR
jgi:hypothetical protein